MVGGTSPPLNYMQIALWIAQLLLDFIKSSNELMSKELEHQVRRQKELEANIKALKALNDMYDHAVTAIAENNGRLMVKINELKREQDALEGNRTGILINYRENLRKEKDGDVLREEL